MRQYEYLLLSDVLEKLFTNATLEDIGKLLPLIGGSLTGDCEQNPKNDSENHRTLQARVHIEMVHIF